MRIGIPKETKLEERRVAVAPAGVDTLIRSGHTVYFQSGAGDGSNFPDDEYLSIGANIVYSAEEVFQRSECIIKVASISEEECNYLQENQIIFSFLLLAVSEKKILVALIAKKVTAISYELIENEYGLPVLQAMSEIAGQLAIQVGEGLLHSNLPVNRGVLLGGIPGVSPAAVVIIGAGVVGTAAAKSALGRGAQVIVLDKDLNRLRRIDETFDRKITTVVANPYTINRGVKFADILIGAVLIKGEKTPHIVTEEMVKSMKKGAVIVDVSIDQGGCVETSRPTTISDPIYITHNVIHSCVPNMPSLVSRTASYALTNSALPYIESVADNGLSKAVLEHPGLLKGVCTFNGYCSNEILADTFDLEFRRIHFFSTN